MATELIGESQDDSACGGPDPGPYSRNNCRDPLKGGLKIQRVGTNGICTSGFLAKKPNGTWLLVTAGHCITADGTGTDWKHNGNQFGTDLGDTLPPLVGNPAASADFGWIAIDGTEDKSPANEFFRLNNSDIWPILHVGTNASHEVGEWHAALRSAGALFAETSSTPRPQRSTVRVGTSAVSSGWTMTRLAATAAHP